MKSKKMVEKMSFIFSSCWCWIEWSERKWF